MKMNAELSRRIGKVIDILMKNGMTLDERYDIINTTNSIDGFEDLPIKIQKMIIFAEQTK